MVRAEQFQCEDKQAAAFNFLEETTAMRKRLALMPIIQRLEQRNPSGNITRDHFQFYVSFEGYGPNYTLFQLHQCWLYLDSIAPKFLSR